MRFPHLQFEVVPVTAVLTLWLPKALCRSLGCQVGDLVELEQQQLVALPAVLRLYLY